MWVPRPLWSPARKLGFHGSLAQATSISSMSGPPPAAAGHSVAPARGVRASGQPWSCARAGSAVPSRALLVTCPQQPGAWPLVLGRRVSPRLACQFSMPAPHGFVGRVWHSPGETLLSWPPLLLKSVAAPGPAVSRDGLARFQSFIASPFALGLRSRGTGFHRWG